MITITAYQVTGNIQTIKARWEVIDPLTPKGNWSSSFRHTLSLALDMGNKVTIEKR